jgi:hypothetical protein
LWLKKRKITSRDISWNVPIQVIRPPIFVN